MNISINFLRKLLVIVVPGNDDADHSEKFSGFRNTSLASQSNFFLTWYPQVEIFLILCLPWFLLSVLQINILMNISRYMTSEE